jgi:polyferredoxin
MAAANVRPGAGIDVLRWPVIGAFLRWRHARTAFQIVGLALALVIVGHGLFGPDLAPLNLATVLSWVHYRGLLVVALLVAGNLFCTACPFVLVRDAGRRVHTPARRWPRALRTKWAAIALLLLVLFAYERLDLWALPRATAWLVVGYFAAALAVDLLFRGATFCKYLCPIGQFNFIASTVSPLELQVTELATCGTCATSDCIRGRRDPVRPEVVVQRGCELSLFLPSKVGNLDCTMCLDCVHACPHDNIALAVRVPAAELSDDRRHSGIGRPSGRHDIAALAVVFAFAGLLNAFAMVAPAGDTARWIGGQLGTGSETVTLAILFALGIVVIPWTLVGGAAAASRLAEPRPRPSVRQTAATYAYALVPFGFGVWLAHYGFHLLTGVLTVVPVAQSAVAEIGGQPWLGVPWWGWVGLRPGSVLPVQLGFVLLGAMGSLAVAQGIAERRSAARSLTALAPWAVLIVGLAAVAAWMFTLPMDLRGTGLPG